MNSPLMICIILYDKETDCTWKCPSFSVWLKAFEQVSKLHCIIIGHFINLYIMIILKHNSVWFSGIHFFYLSLLVNKVKYCLSIAHNKFLSFSSFACVSSWVTVLFMASQSSNLNRCDVKKSRFPWGGWIKAETLCHSLPFFLLSWLLQLANAHSQAESLQRLRWL